MPGPTNTGGTRLHKQSFTQSAADHEVERLAWQPWVGGGFTFSLMVTGLFSWPQLRSSMPPPDPAQVEVASRSLCFVDRLMGTWSKLEQPDLLALLCCSSKALNHARPCRCVCPSSKDPHAQMLGSPLPDKGMHHYLPREDRQNGKANRCCGKHTEDRTKVARRPVDLVLNVCEGSKAWIPIYASRSSSSSSLGRSRALS